MPAAAHPEDVATLLAANEAFYAAFEAGDLDAMSEVWSHAEDAACTHPGWPTLHGWAAISASWFALFQGGPSMQLILTEARPTVVGDAGWVTVDENLIAGTQAQTVAALNVFVRQGGAWRMVAHHGSGIARA